VHIITTNVRQTGTDRVTDRQTDNKII